MLLRKGEDFRIICQNAVNGTPFIIQTVFNDVCIFLYVGKVISDIFLTQYQTLIFDAFKIVGVKVFLPIEWNIATFDN